MRNSYPSTFRVELIKAAQGFLYFGVCSFAVPLPFTSLLQLHGYCAFPACRSIYAYGEKYLRYVWVQVGGCVARGGMPVKAGCSKLD